MKSSVGCTSYMQQGPFGLSKTMRNVQQLVCNVQGSWLPAQCATQGLKKLQWHHVGNCRKVNSAQLASQALTNCLLMDINQLDSSIPCGLP
jgi:hypothetical protein